MNPIHSSQDLFRLDEHVAIITGAAGLLGKQHAIALSDMGAHVVLADLHAAQCQERAEEITTQTGIEAMSLECDVTDKDAWIGLRDAVMARFSRIDVLINNAAFTNQSQSANYNAPFPAFPVEDWNQLMAVNLTGPFLGCQVIGEQMVAQGSGSIINLASLYGVVSPNHRMYPGTGIVQPVAYSVSKAGVMALTRYLATLWAEKGVRVNSITPGGVFDNHEGLFAERFAQLNPTGRMAQPEEMRGAIIYLASAASNYCTGHNLVVDGGWTVW